MRHFEKRAARALVLVLAAALLAALPCACDGDGGGAQAPDGAGDAAGDTAGGPDGGAADTAAAAGPFTPARRAALAVALEDYVAFSGDPGIAFAVSTGAGAVWTGEAGLADLRSEAPVTPERRFRVGSNTKPMVAAVVLQLVEDGAIDLDAAVSDYLTEDDRWPGVTVRQLLEMTSGIPEYLSATPLLAATLSTPERVYAPDEVLDFAAGLERAFAPGEGCAYSNSNWFLLGLIVEAVTGRPLATELEERFFAPLGLTDTTFERPGDPTDDVVRGYLDGGLLGAVAELPPIIFQVLPDDLQVGDGPYLDGSDLLNPSLTWAAGAVVSRPADLARFHRALQAEGLVSADTLAAMRDVHECSLLGGTIHYGLGMMRWETPFGPAYGHGGLNVGFHVETVYLPDHDLAISHMHNATPAQATAVAEEVLAIVLGESHGFAAACPAPDGLLGAPLDGAPYATFAVKGPVSDPAAPRSAMFDARVDLGGGPVRYAAVDRLGLHAAIVRQPAADERVWLRTLAVGPEPAGSGRLRSIAVEVDEAALATVDADGHLAVAPDATRAPAAPAPVRVVVLDHGVLVEGEAQQPACLVAVSDPGRAAALHTCDPAAMPPVPGARLRLRGRVPLTTQPTALAAAAAAIPDVAPCAAR